MSSLQNPVSRKIDAQFNNNGVWIIEKDRRAEADLFREAIKEIERLDHQLQRAMSQLSDGLEEDRQRLYEMIGQQEAKRDEYAALIDALQPEIKRIRNAAKALVSNIDKTSFHGEEPA